MIKKTNMGNDEGSKQKKTSDTIVDDSDVLPPSWVRCSIFYTPKTSRFLYDYHFIFLPCISILFWSIFFIFWG